MHIVRLAERSPAEWEFGIAIGEKWAKKLPEYAAIHGGLGTLYWTIGREKRSRKQYEKALKSFELALASDKILPQFLETMKSFLSAASSQLEALGKG